MLEYKRRYESITWQGIIVENSAVSVLLRFVERRYVQMSQDRVPVEPFWNYS